MCEILYDFRVKIICKMLIWGLYFPEMRIYMIIKTSVFKGALDEQRHKDPV